MVSLIDSRLLERTHVKLVEEAKATGIQLEQTYAGEGTAQEGRSRCGHARQFWRARAKQSAASTR